MTNSKTALITGASSGIGAEYARQLAAQGYDLVITARREEKLRTLAEQIKTAHAVRVEVLPADLSDVTAIDKMAAYIRKNPHITILVNNAGFGVSGQFAEVDFDKWQGMMNVHMLATTQLTHAALPAMLKGQQGTIINISSIASFISKGGGPMYSATKAYLNYFSTNLQSELKGTGIDIQALCPGYTYTEFHDTPEYADFSRSQIPESLWMTAEEVVRESLDKAGHKVIVVPGRQYKTIVFLMRYGLSGMVSTVRGWFKKRE